MKGMRIQLSTLSNEYRRERVKCHSIVSKKTYHMHTKNCMLRYTDSPEETHDDEPVESE